MAFRPLGDRVDIRSPLSVATVKAALQKGMKPWFDSRRGPRGWMLGGLLCLWLDPYDRSGPMLLAVIRQDESGTRVTGRGGSDLNGTLYIGILGTIFVSMMLIGAPPERGLWAMTGAIFALVVVSFWIAHRYRRDADPLVRFVARSLEAIEPVASTPLPGLTLSVDGSSSVSTVSTDLLSHSLAELGPAGTLVLVAADEMYIQTLMFHGLFAIEKRDGDADRHFELVRDPAMEGRQFVSLEVANAVFLAHVRGDNPPRGHVWRKVDVGMPSNLLSSFG